MMPERDGAVTSTYESPITAKPFVPAACFDTATLGADCVANKLFIAFLFSDIGDGVHFTKDVVAS